MLVTELTRMDYTSCMERSDLVSLLLTHCNIMAYLQTVMMLQVTSHCS
jgi:hypothetical protein